MTWIHDFSINGNNYLLLSFSANLTQEVGYELSQSEREVCSLLLSGFSRRKIAEERSASVNTINNQLNAIYRKFGVRSRKELEQYLLAQAI